MSLFTVIIPTHEHVATLPWAIRSVLDQSIQDFRLTVIGDGAPAATDTLMEHWMSRDTRISYIPHPKGDGYGEAYRHEALCAAESDYVAYLGDDDIWMPHHLETLALLLKDHDLAHTPATEATRGGHFVFHPARFDSLYYRACNASIHAWLTGPSTLGHRLDSYHRLPHGWNPKPANKKSDNHMWQQWLSQPWLRAGYDVTASSLHIGSPERGNLTDEERGKESEYWYRVSREPDFQARVQRAQLEQWQRGCQHPRHQALQMQAALEERSLPDDQSFFLSLYCAESRRHPVDYLLRQALRAHQHGRVSLSRRLYQSASPSLATPQQYILAARYCLQDCDTANAACWLAHLEDQPAAPAAEVARLKSRLLSLNRAGKFPWKGLRRSPVLRNLSARFRKITKK